MPESADRYLAREEEWTRKRDGERRASASIARLRLATFLGAVAATVWWLGFAGAMPAFVTALVLYLLFGALVFIHSKIEDRAEWFEALRVVNARALARVSRHWEALPDAAPPPGVVPENHPYAVDLDVLSSRAPTPRRARRWTVRDSGSAPSQTMTWRRGWRRRRVSPCAAPRRGSSAGR